MPDPNKLLSKKQQREKIRAGLEKLRLLRRGFGWCLLAAVISLRFGFSTDGFVSMVLIVTAWFTARVIRLTPRKSRSVGSDDSANTQPLWNALRSPCRPRRLTHPRNLDRIRPNDG